MANVEYINKLAAHLTASLTEMQPCGKARHVEEARLKAIEVGLISEEEIATHFLNHVKSCMVLDAGRAIFLKRILLLEEGPERESVRKLMMDATSRHEAGDYILGDEADLLFMTLMGQHTVH